MRRLIATLLGVALICSSAQVAALHVHVYSDHDHPEHHHAPAAHDHAGADSSQDDEDVAHVEACEPGQHSLSVILGCATVQQLHAIDAEAACPGVAEPLIDLRNTSEITDVRVHGPPARTHAPPRAPPLTVPA